MAHEIESALFIGEPAWHGLGTVVQEAPSLADAIKMAGLDWTVRTEPLFLADGREIRDSRAVVRESDQSILGAVGPSWTPLQNADAFEWFEPLVASGDVKLEAAGSLRFGQRVWVLAKCATAEVKAGDPVDQFILLSNGHDGKLAVRVGFTAVRVVCANTLAVAHTADASKLIKIKHTVNVHQAIDGVRDIMVMATKSFAGTIEQMRHLARVGCNEKTLHRYVREVFEPGKADDEMAAKRTLDRIAPLFEEGRGAELSRGTMWGAFNAVTEFVTHERGRTKESRLDAQWFGDGAQLVTRALDTAMAFAA